MSERITILTPDVNFCPLITVNTAVLSVPIPNMVGPVAMYSSDTVTYLFSNGDNIELLSIGFFIPERFVLYDSLPGVGATAPFIIARLYAYQNVSGVSVPLNQFGNNGNIKIPFPNYELALGVFVDAATEIGEAFYMQIEFPITTGFDVWNISMVNVPVALNGQTFHIVPFIKVLHNFALT